MSQVDELHVFFLQNDERDTAYAQQYMEKVRETFADNQDKFMDFLRLLHEFGCSKETPVEVSSICWEWHVVIQKILRNCFSYC